MLQDDDALTVEERRRFREFLSNQTEIPGKVERLERLERKVEKQKREIERMEKEGKEKEIRLKMQAEEKCAKDFLRQFEDKYSSCETWGRKFDEVENDALRHLEEYMQTLHAPEEGIQEKKRALKNHLDNYRERIKDRQKEIKENVMTNLELEYKRDYWILRVEEKHREVREKLMTPELDKDKDVVDLLSDLMKKCEKRRFRIISGGSISGGVVGGVIIGAVVGAATALSVGCVLGIGCTVGGGLVLLIGGGLCIYAHWPQIKNLFSMFIDRIKDLKNSNKQLLSEVEGLYVNMNEIMINELEHPVAGNAVIN